MEPKPNPNPPNTNDTASDSSESTNQSHSSSPQVFSHEKVITPLTNNIQPEEPVAPARITPIISNQAAIPPTPTLPVYPAVAEHAPVNVPRPAPELKPQDNLQKTVLEAFFVFGISAVTGSLFHLWYKLAVRLLPNAVSVCSNAGHSAISFACHGTLFGIFFAFITLFSLASYITYRIMKKSYVLAYYYAGLLVSLLSFFSIALAFEPYAALKFQWLIPGTILWRTWFIPGIASAGLALAIYALSKHSNRLVKNVLSAIYIILFIASLIFVPGLVRNYVSNQNKVTPQEANKLVSSNTKQTAKESKLTLYTITDSTVPVKIIDFRPVLDNPDIVPRYDVFYSLNRAGRYGGMSLETSVYKGSAVGYNPPTNCADYKKSMSQTASPCTLFRTTKSGRQIYG